jgi:hypothetical protein
MTDWENVGECSTETGKQLQRKLVVREGRNGGMECPDPESPERKQIIDCSQDCKFSDWENVDECSTLTGMQLQRRTIITPEKGLGECIGDLEQSFPCSQDCKVGEWTEWSECSEPCGTGTRTRTREVTQEQRGTGESCPNLTETEECRETDCDYTLVEDHIFTEPIGYNTGYPNKKKSNAAKCKIYCDGQSSCSGFQIFYTDGGNRPTDGRYSCRLIDTASGIEAMEPRLQPSGRTVISRVYYKPQKKGNLNIT